MRISLPEYLPNRMRSPFSTSSGTSFPVFQALALADGYHFSFLRLLFGGIRNKQTTNFGLLLLDPFHHDPVIERSNVHSCLNLLLR